MILLYHYIGTEILKRQTMHGWGAKIIDNLSHDLQLSFPEMKGFSTRNLKYMRKFAEEYSEMPIVQQLVAQLPWGHNIYLIESIAAKETRLFYAQKAIENGWSRNVMEMQVETSLHKSQGKAITNFDTQL